MRIDLTRSALLALLAAGLIPLPARAANIATYTPMAVPYTWDNTKSIVYDVDQGKLGSLDNAKATTLVENAFAVWSGVSTAKLTFEEGDPLDRDVTGANLADFLNGLPSDVNPIIFDNDGSVMDALLGAGASLQLLTAGGILQATPTGRIAQGAVIINARAMDGLFDPDDVTTDVLTRYVAQAVGVMLGLGFSDLNDPLIYDGKVADLASVPLMHTGTFINGDQVPVLAGPKLTLDDQMAISELYPADSFPTSTGIIQGQVLLPDGVTGLQGIDVIARKVDDPINTAVSAISGESFEASSGFGSRDPSLRGVFTLHVPPGSYALEFRPVREPFVGPLQTSFPLPGGPQFYGASGTQAPAAAPVMIPATATPVTVTANQTTTVKLVAAGTPGPAPQNVTAVTAPHDSTETAQPLPLSAVVTGHVAPSMPGTPGQIVLDTGGGMRDKVEDLYQIVVPQQSIITLRLEPQAQVDLDLYLFGGIAGGAVPPIVASSAFGGTDPEALQAAVGPGVYYIGVSSWDNVQHPAATNYTLSLVTTTLPIQPNPQRPVLNQFVLGNITDKTADVNWITDTPASSVAVVSMPRQQFGDPNLGTMHHVALSGLTPGAYADLFAISQNAAGVKDLFPKFYWRTADTTAGTTGAPVQAAVTGVVEDSIYNGDTDLITRMVEIAIQNTGAPVTNVQITGLTASMGWKLAAPVTQPLTVGGIGTNGIAIVGVRLLRDGTGPAPLATVTGTGTLTGSDGKAANFTIGS